MNIIIIIICSLQYVSRHVDYNDAFGIPTGDIVGDCIYASNSEIVNGIDCAIGNNIDTSIGYNSTDNNGDSTINNAVCTVLIQ